MLTYFIIIFICFNLAFAGSKCKNITDRKIIMTVLFFILFLFSALRYDTGYDYSYTYLPGYYKIVNGGVTHFEPLFVLLNKFVFYVFNNVDFLFGLCSFITIGIIVAWVFKESSDYFISIVMLFATRFYLYSFTQVRQYIAIAIFLYSIKYIINKNFKKYFFNIIIASLFHKTAFLYFPIYFLNRLKIDRKKFLLIFIIAPLFSPLFNRLYIIIGNYFYHNYMASNYGVGNSSIVSTVLALIFSIITFIYMNKLDNDKYNIYINLQLLVWVLITNISGINESYRIIGMFMYSSIVLMSECYYLSNKKQKIVFSILLLTISIYSTYLMLIYDGSKMIPYRTIFNKNY